MLKSIKKSSCYVSLLLCFSLNLFSAENKTLEKSYPQPGVVEIVRSTPQKTTIEKVVGGTLFTSEGEVKTEVLAKGVVFNVQVTSDPKTGKTSYVYLDEYGKPLPDQKKWAELSDGAPLPVETRMWFSEGAPDVEALFLSMRNWTVTSLEFPNYYKTTYTVGFSGIATPSTHAFLANGAYVLSGNFQGDYSIALSSDDNASLTVKDLSCQSTLHVSGSASGTLPSATTSIPITWTYENIGGPYSLSISFVVLRSK